MKRELSYREEMVQQLHIVRGERNKAEGARIYRFTGMFADVIDDSLCAQNALCVYRISRCVGLL